MPTDRIFDRNTATPVVLATRYLIMKWGKRHHGEIPSDELTRAVVDVVLALGYKKDSVDKLIAAYEQKDKV